MKTVVRKSFFFSGIFVFAALGVVVGSWLLRGQYPVSEKHRVLLTTTIKPGQPLEIAREVDRRENCEINVRGYTEYADGKRVPLVQKFEPGFGPLGFDAYIMEIETSPTAVYGPAYVWSKPGAACNPLEYLFNILVPGQEKIDHFMVGPEPVRVPVPDELKIRRPAQARFNGTKNRPGTEESNRHIDPSGHDTAFPGMLLQGFPP